MVNDKKLSGKEANFNFHHCHVPAGHLPLPLLSACGAEHDDVPAAGGRHHRVGELLLLRREVAQRRVPQVGGARGGDTDLKQFIKLGKNYINDMNHFTFLDAEYWTVSSLQKQWNMQVSLPQCAGGTGFPEMASQMQPSTQYSCNTR